MSKYTITKICTQCGEEKTIADFYKRKASADGLQPCCQVCEKAYSIAYGHTQDGLITEMYGSQRSSSKQRNHNCPEYSKAELALWVFSQRNFKELYRNWADSEYKTLLKPSCDRLDDYKPYALDNLRLITWQQNNAKSHADRKNGANNKRSKAILQLTREGIIVAEYHSQHSARRETGVHEQRA